MSKTADVRRFHQAMGLPISEPWIQASDLQCQSERGVTEEFWEFVEAINRQDRTEVLDALVDMAYTAISYAVTFGWDFDAAWHRVHRSNMAKLGPDGKPIMRDDGKVLKPPGWVPPELGDRIEPAPPLPYPWCTRPRACRHRGFCQAKPVCTE